MGRFPTDQKLHEKEANVSRIVTAGDVRGFFQSELTRVLERQDLVLEPATEFYLVNLLAEFCRAEQLYPKGEDGRSDDVPLALLLKRALELPPPKRVQAFKRMGDQSLYVSGFFSDSLSRKLVDVDYYIEMGHRAYDSAAEVAGTLSRRHALVEIFQELAHKFVKLVDALMELSEEVRATADSDLVRLYEKWVATGSERLGRKLIEAGLLPTAPLKPGTTH